MSIITCATSKGGCGKTTVAQVLLGGLHARGYQVAGIDADYNQTLANWVESIAGLPVSVIREIDETNIVPTAAELEEKNQAVIIDTAGAATQATVFAVGCADLVLIPIQTSSSDVVEAIKTVRLVESAAKMTKRKIKHRVIFTDYQPHTNVTSHVEREVGRYKLPAMAARLNRLVAFKEMTFTGDVPRTGSAGEQVGSLFEELKKLGALSFYS